MQLRDKLGIPSRLRAIDKEVPYKNPVLHSEDTSEKFEETDGPKGQKVKDLLIAYVEQHPGASAIEIARGCRMMHTSVSANLYVIFNTLELRRKKQDGLLRYYPTSSLLGDLTTRERKSRVYTCKECPGLPVFKSHKAIHMHKFMKHTAKGQAVVQSNVGSLAKARASRKATAKPVIAEPKTINIVKDESFKQMAMKYVWETGADSKPFKDMFDWYEKRGQ